MADQVAEYVLRARDEATSVLDRLSGGLFDLRTSMESLARAAGPMGTLAVALTGVGAAAAVGAIKLADQVEQLDRLSQISGVSVDKLQAIHQVLKESGGDAEGLPVALVRLNRAIQSGNPLLGALGITTTDTFEAFMQLSNAISSSSNAKLRDEVAIQLMGKSAADLIPDLIAINANLAQMTEKLDKAGASFKGEALDGALQLGDELDVFSTNFELAMQRIQLAAIPAVNGIVSAFNDMWSAMSGPNLADVERRIKEATNALAQLEADNRAHGDPNRNQNTIRVWQKTLFDLQAQRVQFAKPEVTTGLPKKKDPLDVLREYFDKPNANNARKVSAADIAARGWFDAKGTQTPTQQLEARIAEQAETSRRALQNMGRTLEELPVPALRLTEAGIKAYQAIERWERTSQQFANSVASDMTSVATEVLTGSIGIKAAWHDLMQSILRDIASSAADFGVGLLLDLIPIPGTGALDKVGGIGKLSAQSAGGGYTFNISTLDAKTVVQELTSPSGSLRRANDYVRAVSRAGSR